MFIAFAPRDNPKIAIATVVENAGYGSTYAAPISALMMEKYLRPDTTSSRMDLYNRMTGKTATHTTAHQADTSHGAGE